MYMLMLTSVRSTYNPTLKPVAKSEDPHQLVNLLLREQVPLYHDPPYYKYFRKDGPLEWFNPPDEPFTVESLLQSTRLGIQKWLTEEEAIELARQSYQHTINTLPDAETL